MKPCPAPHLLFIPTRSPWIKWMLADVSVFVTGVTPCEFMWGCSNKLSWERFRCSMTVCALDTHAALDVRQATLNPSQPYFNCKMAYFESITGPAVTVGVGNAFRWWCSPQRFTCTLTNTRSDTRFPTCNWLLMRWSGFSLCSENAIYPCSLVPHHRPCPQAP